MPAQELHTHLESGSTTVARTWAIYRKDGTVFGFTDHDKDLSFEGITFRADSGLTARALQQSTGLSVDNTEALGALTAASIREEDIAAGRFDGAEVATWLVNWKDVAERKVLFRGSIGEIRRGAGAFHAELRGLSEALNRPLGRVFQKPCSAVLGDGKCQFDTETAGYFHETPLISVEEKRVFVLEGLEAFAPGWFQRGQLRIVTGEAQGLSSAIKRDHVQNGVRLIEIWEPLRAQVSPGDTIRVVAGCDKRFATCGSKFMNVVNFQGFPDLPDEDWASVSPTASSNRSGGSRR